jgi:hypothetical protein
MSFATVVSEGKRLAQEADAAGAGLQVPVRPPPSSQYLPAEHCSGIAT